MASTVELHLVPQLGSALSALADAIEQFAAAHELGGEIPFRLNLVLDELVTNSINYGLRDVEDAKLLVRLTSGANGVVAQLEDNGPMFDPFERVSEPDKSQSLQDRPVGGLGLFFVTQFADSASYERGAELNRITLRIKET